MKLVRMPRPNVRQARTNQIIAAALQVFQRSGYHNATMPEIATEAGLSIGGMYWYFKSKDALVVAILEQLFTTDLDEIAALLTADTPTGERLMRFAEHFVALFDRHRWSLPIGIDLYSAAGHDPEMRAFIRRYLGRYREALVSLISQGIARNEFRPVDPNDTANAFLALEEGLALLLSIEADAVRWKESFLTGTQLFIDGLARRP